MLQPENPDKITEGSKPAFERVIADEATTVSNNGLRQLIDRFHLTDRISTENIDSKKWEALVVQANKYSAIGRVLQKHLDPSVNAAISDISSALNVIKSNEVNLKKIDPGLYSFHDHSKSFIQIRESELVKTIGIVSKIEDIEALINNIFSNESLRVKAIDELLVVLLNRFNSANFPAIIDQVLGFFKNNETKIKNIGDFGGLCNLIDGGRKLWGANLEPKIFEATLNQFSRLLAGSSREEVVNFEKCSDLSRALSEAKNFITAENINEYFGLNQDSEVGYRKLCNILSITSRVIATQGLVDPIAITRVRVKAEELINFKSVFDPNQENIAEMVELLLRGGRPLNIDALDAAIKCEKLLSAYPVSEEMFQGIQELIYTSLGSVISGSLTPFELVESINEICSCLVSRAHLKQGLSQLNFFAVLSLSIRETKVCPSISNIRAITYTIRTLENTCAGSERGKKPESYFSIHKFINKFGANEVENSCNRILDIINHAINRQAWPTVYLSQLAKICSRLHGKVDTANVQKIISIMDQPIKAGALIRLGTQELYVQLIGEILGATYKDRTVEEIATLSECIMELAEDGYNVDQIVQYLNSLFTAVEMKDGLVNMATLSKLGIKLSLNFLRGEEIREVIQYLNNLSTSGSEIKILKGQLRLGSTTITPLANLLAVSMATELEDTQTYFDQSLKLPKLRKNPTSPIIKSENRYNIEVSTVGEFFKQKPGTKLNPAVCESILNYARRSSALDLVFENTDLSPNEFRFDRANGIVSGLQFFQTRFLQDMKVRCQTGASFKQGVNYPSLEELEALDEAITAELDKYEREVLPPQMTFRLRVTKGLLDLCLVNAGPDTLNRSTPNFFNEKFQPIRIEGPNFEQVGAIYLFREPVGGKDALIIGAIRIDKNTAHKLDNTCLIKNIIEVARYIGQRNNLPVYLHHVTKTPIGNITENSLHLSEGVRLACLDRDLVDIGSPKGFKIFEDREFYIRDLYKL